MTMTKKDFINAVAKNGNMTKKSAEEAVAVVLETIMGTLANGDSVNFFGFGKFSAVRQDACVKRNPILAIHAVTSTELALAGIESKIPLDEVIDAVRQTGQLMSPMLKESSLAGLATTKTALKLKEKI